jgi:hypothetical protein
MSIFDPRSRAGARFFHLASLSAMIRSQLQGVRIQWGSVIFLPFGWYSLWPGLEEHIPVMKNPFGAFFGLAFSVTFSFRTIQEVIREPVVLQPDGQRPMPGIVREFKRGFRRSPCGALRFLPRHSTGRKSAPHSS